MAASAGNHAQAVAWAAREAGLRATIFVPQDAAMAKVEAAKGYGADVRMVGDSLEAAVGEAETPRRGEWGDVRSSVRGRGGRRRARGRSVSSLPSRCRAQRSWSCRSVAAGSPPGSPWRSGRRSPKTKVVGVRSAPDGFALADGIAVKQPGALTGPLLDDLLDDVVEVSGADIAQAIVLLLERTKLVVEGAGAVAVAALMEGKIPGDGPAVAVLSGGNIDASTLITVMRYGVTAAGRHLVVRTAVPDRPGELLKLLQLVAEERVNVLSVEHRREGVDIPVGATGIDLTLLTRDEEHCEGLLRQMRGWGYEVERLR